jgi:hypothetical protein
MQEIIGKRFGKWVVRSFSYKNASNHSFYLCHCDCGTDTTIRIDNITSGRSKGCKRCSWKKLWEPEIIDEHTLLIPMTQNKYAIIDKEDFDKIKDHSWVPGPYGKYAVASIKHNMVRMHRLIMGFPQQDIDHINGNDIDNRKQNLRLCSHSQNLRNIPKSSRNTTGFKGVCFDKGVNKFRASIKFNYKTIYLGVFNTAEEASEVYQKKALELHGEFYYKENVNKIEIKEEVLKHLNEKREIMDEQKRVIDQQLILNRQRREQEKQDFKEKNFLKGRRSGNLVAVSFSHFDNGEAIWNCICDCGKEKKTAWYRITSKSTRSCGCLISTCKIKKWSPIIDGNVAMIPLSQGKYAYVDIEDLYRIEKISWYCDPDGYARNRNGIMMHRIIMNCPPDKEIDHKDHNGLNNTKDNLRICTRSQNQANKNISTRNTLGFKGVSYSKKNNKYSASIRCNNKQYHLGYFNTPEEAHQHYTNKGKELFGDFFYNGINNSSSNNITNERVSYESARIFS